MYESGLTLSWWNPITLLLTKAGRFWTVQLLSAKIRITSLVVEEQLTDGSRPSILTRRPFMPTLWPSNTAVLIWNCSKCCTFHNASEMSRVCYDSAAIRSWKFQSWVFLCVPSLLFKWFKTVFCTYWSLFYSWNAPVSAHLIGLNDLKVSVRWKGIYGTTAAGLSLEEGALANGQRPIAFSVAPVSSTRNSNIKVHACLHSHFVMNRLPVFRVLNAFGLQFYLSIRLTTVSKEHTPRRLNIEKMQSQQIVSHVFT